MTAESERYGAEDYFLLQACKSVFTQEDKIPNTRAVRDNGAENQKEFNKNTF